MSKFKVGDKVALKNSPYVEVGTIDSNAFGYYLIDIGNESYKMVEEDDITLIEQIPDMTNNEIYYMLKPKLEKAEVIKNKYNMTTVNVNEAVGLAYRSGYLRAKKGRPFKIGGEKE